MTVYDAQQRRLVVRVVYDGPAHSGKTTNLRQVCAYFTTQRRGDLIVPEERGGRTLFFDWVHLDGGLVAGHALRCQLVSVPGQAALSRRRQHIIEGADALVLVCDSTPRGARAAQALLPTLRAERPGRRPRPLVVQANKQDLDGALSPEELRDVLGLEPDVRIVAANAERGVGVRETLVLAVRAAAEDAQQELRARGLPALAGAVEEAADLHRALLAVDAAAPGDALSLALLAARRLVDQEGSAAPADLDERGDASAATDTAASHPSARALGRAAPRVSAPPLPVADVPSGHVWPAARGREILRSLPLERLEPRPDLDGRTGDADGGESDAWLYRAGDWRLATSARRRFRDLDAARAAIVDLVRRKLLLGPLLPRDSVVVLRAHDGEAWLWTVAPWLPTLGAALQAAEARGDEAGLARELEAFGEVATAAVRLAMRHGVALDVHPGNFARDATGLCYVADDVSLTRRLPALAQALLQRVEEYAHRPAAVERYVARLERSLPESSGPADPPALDLRAALEATPAHHPASERARERLVRALWHRA